MGVLWLCCVPPVFGQDAQPAQSEASRQSAAVELARAGRLDEALAELARLRAGDPGSTSLLYDEIVVLGWAERDGAVRDRAADVDREAAPLHVLLTVGKSLRNLRRFDEAVEWYARALQSAPSSPDARLGLALTYADAGRFERAERTLAPLADTPGQRVAAGIARAYIDERAGRWMSALSSYDRVLERAPDNPAALRGKALVLRRLLLPSEALSIAEAHPGILTDNEVARLRADEIALEVRYGTQVDYPVGQRHAAIDRAIAALDAYLAQGVDDPRTELALRSDRIIALAERGSSAEAVDAFERLESEHADLSAAVLAAAGKAYLDVRAPERALEVLERAVELAPRNLDLSFALFYAYGDLGRTDTALALARRIASDLPLTLGPAGSPAARPNPDRIRAEILVALALAYADRLDEAQAHLEGWLAEAPNNPDLRHELANIYRWRGWPDRSLFQYRQVLALEPELLEARVGRAYTQLDRNRFEDVEAEVEALNTDFAEQSSVERLTTLWTVHNRSELSFDANAHDSSGVTFGSSQYDWSLTWLSAPIDYRYRAYVSSRDAFAEFPEGESRRRRLAAGARYQYGRWLASAELSADRRGGGLGARGSAEYRLDDYWSLSSFVELESDTVPLRGYRVGIDSNLVGVGARYAPDETMTLSMSAEHERLSDGNSRTQASARGRRRLLNESEMIVELVGEAFLGRRNREDVPYFSPLRDTGVIVGVETQWQAYRRYERSLTHILRGEIGLYDQSGYPRGTIARLAYMLPMELSPGFSAWLGVWRNRMFYDGVEEYSTTASLSLQVRF